MRQVEEGLGVPPVLHALLCRLLQARYRFGGSHLNRKQLVRVNQKAMEKDITITWSSICGAENLGDIFFSLNLGTLSPYLKCKALLALLLLC